MKQGNLLVIVDDARVSRLICHVAERFDMSCLTINKSGDIGAACKEFSPDVILLDPEPLETQGVNALRTLAEVATNAAIVLTSASPDEAKQLAEMAESLGLNMVGVLPDVFDAEILKQEFNLIFQRVSQPAADKPAANAG